jgi:hypothetical protein
MADRIVAGIVAKMYGPDEPEPDQLALDIAAGVQRGLSGFPGEAMRALDLAHAELAAISPFETEIKIRTWPGSPDGGKTRRFVVRATEEE